MSLPFLLGAAAAGWLAGESLRRKRRLGQAGSPYETEIAQIEREAEDRVFRAREELERAREAYNRTARDRRASEDDLARTYQSYVNAQENHRDAWEAHRQMRARQSELVREFLAKDPEGFARAYPAVRLDPGQAEQVWQAERAVEAGQMAVFMAPAGMTRMIRRGEPTRPAGARPGRLPVRPSAPPAPPARPPVATGPVKPPAGYVPFPPGESTPSGVTLRMWRHPQTGEVYVSEAQLAALARERALPAPAAPPARSLVVPTGEAARGQPPRGYVPVPEPRGMATPYQEMREFGRMEEIGVVWQDPKTGQDWIPYASLRFLDSLRTVPTRYVALPTGIRVPPGSLVPYETGPGGQRFYPESYVRTLVERQRPSMMEPAPGPWEYRLREYPAPQAPPARPEEGGFMRLLDLLRGKRPSGPQTMVAPPIEQGLPGYRGAPALPSGMPMASYGPAGTMTAAQAFGAVETPGAYRPPHVPGGFGLPMAQAAGMFSQAAPAGSALSTVSLSGRTFPRSRRFFGLGQRGIQIPPLPPSEAGFRSMAEIERGIEVFREVLEEAQEDLSEAERLSDQARRELDEKERDPSATDEDLREAGALDQDARAAVEKAQAQLARLEAEFRRIEEAALYQYGIPGFAESYWEREAAREAEEEALERSVLEAEPRPLFRGREPLPPPPLRPDEPLPGVVPGGPAVPPEVERPIGLAPSVRAMPQATYGPAGSVSAPEAFRAIQTPGAWRGTSWPVSPYGLPMAALSAAASAPLSLPAGGGMIGT